MSPRSALFLLGLGVAVGLSWLWPRIQQPPTTHAIARELLATGRPDDALILFDEPIWRGIAEYRAGRYARAVGAFFPPESILDLYNIGTSHAQLESWNGAIAAYEKVLRLDPAHADARHNLELVLRAAEIEGDEAVTPSPNSALQQGEVDQQQEIGDELAEPQRQNTSQLGGSDVLDRDTEIDLSGTSDKPGELGDSQRTQRVGTANITGDPEESREGTLRDKPGSAEVKARESAQAAEILLRHIHDDPEKVLRVRLFTAHQNRQAGTP
jgi:Ca-activated chloride channel family protein